MLVLFSLVSFYKILLTDSQIHIINNNYWFATPTTHNFYPCHYGAVEHPVAISHSHSSLD